MRSFLLLCFAFIRCACVAQEHPNLQDAMRVQSEPSPVHVAVNASLREISVAQGVALAENSTADAATFARAAVKHRGCLLQHLKVSVGTNPLAG